MWPQLHSVLVQQAPERRFGRQCALFTEESKPARSKRNMPDLLVENHAQHCDRFGIAGLASRSIMAGVTRSTPKVSLRSARSRPVPD